MAGQIRRITNKQKKIVNQILIQGLADYYFGDGIAAYDHLARQFNVTDADVLACIEYAVDKFYFYTN